MKNIKSRERVKKYGEVYTPDWMVKKMCDMLENEKQQKMIIKILDKPTACSVRSENLNYFAIIFTSRKRKR